MKLLRLTLNWKKERDTNEPFEVDNDGCGNKGGGEGKSNWVEYMGDP